jgi:hypothetical protein
MAPQPVDNIEKKVLDDFTKWAAEATPTSGDVLARVIRLKAMYLNRDRRRS